jgi:hypothetical protein
MRLRPLAAISAALVLAGCGGSPLEGRTGPEVAAAAADALQEAGSFHLAGTVSRGGAAGAVDLHLQGEDAVGTVTVGGNELQLVNAGGAVYLQAPPEFWTSLGVPEASAAGFDGRWVSLSGEAAAGFQVFTVGGFVDELRAPDGGVEDEVTTTEVDGNDAVVVNLTQGGTLTVLDDDPAYPVEVTNEESGSTGTVTIGRFGETVDISAPKDALDLDALGGGA